MKTLIEATKLENATVNFISLVERGANRIPFRIIKRDKEMVDLSKLFKSAPKQQQDAQKPEVLGFVVEKSESLDHVHAALTANGFSADKVHENEDGTVIFKQADADIDFDAVTVIKMSPDVLVLLKGFDPSAVQGGTFEEVLKAHGFLPSVSMAFDALQTTMITALMEGGDVVSKLDADLEAFHKFVIEQAKSIPANAFKAADEISKSTMGKKKPEMAEEGAEDDAEDEMEDEDEEKNRASMKEETAADEQKDDESVAQKSEDDGLKLVKDSLAELASSVATVAKSVEALSAQISEVKAHGESLSAKVSEVETVAQTAVKSVKGAVIGGMPAGDKEGTAQKADSQTNVVFDTAFQPGIRTMKLSKAVAR